MVDYGAQIEGPGIGLGEGSIGALLLLMACGYVMLLLSWRRAGPGRPRFFAVTAGLVLFVVFAGSYGPQRILRWRWGNGCETHDGRACTALAGLYAAGLGTARDPARAATLRERGCALGDPFGCGDLLEGRPDARRRAQACRGLERGCGRGNRLACQVRDRECTDSGGE